MTTKEAARRASLEEHIRKTLADAPPLSEAQRARIATLFRAGEIRIRPTMTRSPR